MTSGLVMGRRTMFVRGYAVQWYVTFLGVTRVLIYTDTPNHKYVLLKMFDCFDGEDPLTVEKVATEKIKEIERR